VDCDVERGSEIQSRVGFGNIFGSERQTRVVHESERGSEIQSRVDSGITFGAGSQSRMHLRASSV